MSDIVDTLRQEHAQLLALAEELEASPNSWQIEAFKKQLLDHLDLEDAQFYPQLTTSGTAGSSTSSQRTVTT
jgi:hypothetical protein